MVLTIAASARAKRLHRWLYDAGSILSPWSSRRWSSLLEAPANRTNLRRRRGQSQGPQPQYVVVSCPPQPPHLDCPPVSGVVAPPARGPTVGPLWTAGGLYVDAFRLPVHQAAVVACGVGEFATYCVQAFYIVQRHATMSRGRGRGANREAPVARGGRRRGLTGPAHRSGRPYALVYDLSAGLAKKDSEHLVSVRRPVGGPTIQAW